MNEPTRDEWISAYLDGEVPPEKRAEIERWLRDDPEARRLYEELKAVGTSLRSLPRQSLGDDFPDRVLARAEREMLLAPRAADGSSSPGHVADQAEAGDASQPTWGWQRVQRPLIYMLVTLAAGLLVMVWGNPQDERQEPRQLAQHREPQAAQPGELPPGELSPVPAHRDRPLETELRARPSPPADGVVDARPLLEKGGRASEEARPAARSPHPADATARPSMSRAPADRSTAAAVDDRPSVGLRNRAPAAKSTPPRGAADRAAPSSSRRPAPLGKAAPQRANTTPSAKARPPSAPQADDLIDQKAAPSAGAALSDANHRARYPTMPIVVVRWHKGPVDRAHLSRLFAEAGIRLTLLPEADARAKRRRGSGTGRAAPAAPAAKAKAKASADSRSSDNTSPNAVAGPAQGEPPPRDVSQPATSRGVQLVYVEAHPKQIERLITALRDQKAAAVRILPDPHDGQQQLWAQRMAGSDPLAKSSEDAAGGAAAPHTGRDVDRQRLLQLVRLWLAPDRGLLRDAAPADGADSPTNHAVATSAQAWRLPLRLSPDELAADAVPSGRAEQSGRTAPHEPKPRHSAAAENAARQTTDSAAASVAPSGRSSSLERALLVFVVDDASDNRSTVDPPSDQDGARLAPSDEEPNAEQPAPPAPDRERSQ